MTDDIGRPLVDFHTLDQCPSCKRNQMIHTKRYAYPDESFAHVPHIMVALWDCPDCGVMYEEYEDLDGHQYDINGQPLAN